MKRSKILNDIMTSTSVVILSSLLIAGTAQAQNNEDEIIVTARKSAQSIQDVPLAITAFGNAELNDAGFENIVDIAKASPGLFIEKINDRNARVATSPRFRGITFDSTSPLQRTATVFVDGVIVTGGIQGLGVQELERVEIIKGPQSALFGRNTFSGAINYITKDPAKEFGGNVSATVATRDEYRIAGTVEGPILGDSISGSLNASYDFDGGHYDNAANTVEPNQKLGEETGLSLSGSLLFEPTSNFRAKFRANYYENNDGPAATARVGGFSDHNYGGFAVGPDGSTNVNGPSIIPTFGQLNSGAFTESVFRGSITAPDNSLVGVDSDQEEFDLSVTRAFAGGTPVFLGLDFDDLGGAGLVSEGIRFTGDIEYEFDNGITFNALAGYNEDEYLIYTDFDSTAGAGFNATGAQTAEDFSLEARLSGSALSDDLSWTLGGSYVDVDIATAEGFWDTNLGFWFPGLYQDASVTGAKTTGIFGILDYSVTDELTLIFEGRYQEDEISNASLPNISPGTFKKFLPRVLAQYQPNPDTTLYANYSVGNLPGGFNPEVGELNTSQLAALSAQNPGVTETFAEEKLENFEFGWKQSAFDGDLAFNFAAFLMKRTDQIFSGFQVVDEPAGAPTPTRTVAFTDNGATTNLKGFELDVSLNATENLSFQGSLAYVDARIDSFPEGAGAGDYSDVFGEGADPAGQQAPRFPPWMGSLSGTYEKPMSSNFLGGEGSWYTRGDVYYRGQFFDEITNVAQIDAAVDVNLRAGIRNDSVRFELFVTNLFEETSPVGANNISDTSASVRFGSNLFDFFRESTHVALRDKRQFGARIDYTF